MKKFSVSILSLFFVALMSVPMVWGQLPPVVAAYGREFAKEVLGFQAAYASATNRIPARYERDLEILQNKFQLAGNLDGLLAVQKEIERYKRARAEEADPFELAPEMPESAIVSKPAELRQLQERYIESIKVAANTLKKKLSESGEHLCSQIRASQTALTKAGKIKEAIAMRTAGDQIAAIIESGDISALVGPQGCFTTQAGGRGASSSFASGAGSAANWRLRGTTPFSRNLPRYVSPDVPTELAGSYNASRGVYTISGKCTVWAAHVEDMLCVWNGLAFVWDVPSVDDLATDIRIVSKTLSAGADKGPQLEMAVLGNGQKIKSLSIPITASDEIVRIARDTANPARFALYWPRGKQSETFEVRSGVRLTVLIGAVMHNSGEACDLSFQIGGSSSN